MDVPHSFDLRVEYGGCYAAQLERSSADAVWKNTCDINDLMRISCGIDIVQCCDSSKRRDNRVGTTTRRPIKTVDSAKQVPQKQETSILKTVSYEVIIGHY